MTIAHALLDECAEGEHCLCPIEQQVDAGLFVFSLQCNCLCHVSDAPEIDSVYETEDERG